MFAQYKPMFTQHQDGHLTVVPIPKGKNAVLSLLYETLSDFYLPYFLQAQIATFQETLRLRVKGGSNVGLHLQLLRLYLPTYSVTFAGSVIGFIYAFVLGYLSGRTVIALYHRLAGWIG
jgi:ABC-type phosphate/phosphonate transport system permease subunit